MKEEFNFENNAKESFKFFINEEGDLALNVRDGKELVGCFILNNKEIEELKKYLNNIL